MRPDMLRVDGVPPETRAALQEAARRLYGQPNASLLVRQLIAAHLTKAVPPAMRLTHEQASDTVRVELRLPRAAVEQATALADGRFSARNHYLASIILERLGAPQLQGDEIEVLRRSNYELAKVGSNLNQIAKAFNILVKMRGGDKMPEVGKKWHHFAGKFQSTPARCFRFSMRAPQSGNKTGAASGGAKINVKGFIMTGLHTASDKGVLGQNQQPQWTQEEAINYECAREVITNLRAILTGQIYDESGKPHPDAARIESLRMERSRLFRERADLHVRDHDKIACIRAEYGARVCSWRAGNQAVAVESAWH